jgi:hypothetical protein
VPLISHVPVVFDEDCCVEVPPQAVSAEAISITSTSCCFLVDISISFRIRRSPPLP